MDEPFASVDAQTRSELEDLMLDLWSTYGMTVLLVTHDIDEAVYLADRVLALSTSPSRVTGEFHIDLARPRNQINTKDLPAFAHLRTDVLKLIQNSSSTAQHAPAPAAVAGHA
jgi:NitT/TauT family transport system ATP-binding protein